MPGIAGFIGAGSSAENSLAVQQMIDRMKHEATYFSGTYSNEKLGIWVGWVGHKGSFTDCMPVWNEDRTVSVIFSGEVFTDKDELSRLKAQGHDCDLNNASYLVHLYEEMGLKFIESLNGWFCGVLIDIRKQSIVLFNDRYGLTRINYHENTRGLFFSSEAKSLLHVLPELRQLDMTSLGEKFNCGCVMQNRTIFHKISLLPGGAMWMFTGKGKIKKGIYFNRDSWEAQPQLNSHDFYGRLKETFSRILPKYFSGESRVAMSLTGGLDGRMIMALSKCLPGALPCYSFGSSYRDCTDVRLARRVAEICKQTHATITVDDRFCAEFPFLAEKAVFISDGTMDVTGAVELFVNRIARQVAPVRLTGNYGSEILRGGVAFRPNSINENLLDTDFAVITRSAAKTYSTERKCHNVSFIAFKQVPWHHYSRLSVELSQLTLRSPYLDNDFVSLMYQAPQSDIESKELSLRLIADGSTELARVPTDRGLLYDPIPVLTKCRHMYEEFMFKAEYAYDYGMPQWLTKIDHLLSPLHPEKIFLGRHKFYHFRVWYRDALSGYVKDILLDSRTRSRPYLNGKSLEKMVSGHLSGVENHTAEIHRILTSELIQRQLIEN